MFEWVSRLDVSLDYKCQDVSLDYKCQDVSLDYKCQDVSLDYKCQDVTLDYKWVWTVVFAGSSSCVVLS